MKKTYQLLLHPKQVDFLSCQERYRGFVGGRGSGKSFIGSYDLLTKASQKKDRLYMVVAPTYKILRDATCRSFITLGRRLNMLLPGARGFNKTEFRARLTSGSEVVFKSAEDPESLRGPNISGLWFDEAQGSSHEAFLNAIGCLREDPVYNWCTATFTPKGKRHWTYNTFARKNEYGEYPPNTAIFRSSTRDNPFLPDTFVSDLRSQYTTATQEQELEGEFLDAGGTLFKREWFTNKIVNQTIRENRRVRYWDKACLVRGTLITTSAGQIPIEDVLPGMLVLTRQGWCAVKKSWKTKEVSEVTEVSFSNGLVLTGTGDHLVWTMNRDWVPLDELEPTDACFGCRSEKGRLLSPVSRNSRCEDPVPVYDLMIDDVPEFFANGVLVHNSTDDGGCYTCGTLISESADRKYFVESVIRGQWSTFTRDEIIKLTAELDQEKYGFGGVRIAIEEEGGSGGKDSARMSIRDLAGYIVQSDRPTGDKRVRAEPFAAQVEAGNVFMVNDDNGMPWIQNWIDELVSFPEGKICDQVDSVSSGFNLLRRGSASKPVTDGASSSSSGSLPTSTNGDYRLLGIPAAGQQSHCDLRNFKPR